MKVWTAIKLFLTGYQLLGGFLSETTEAGILHPTLWGASDWNTTNNLSRQVYVNFMSLASCLTCDLDDFIFFIWADVPDVSVFFLKLIFLRVSAFWTLPVCVSVWSLHAPPLRWPRSGCCSVGLCRTLHWFPFSNIKHKIHQKLVKHQ